MNFLLFYPLPNRPPDSPTGANNFRANGVTALTRNNFAVKVDHNFGAGDRVTVRYLYNSDNSYRSSVYPNPAADTANKDDYHQQFWHGAWTHLLSPVLVNELRFTYGIRYADTYSPGLGGNWPSKLGLRGVADDAFPTISVAGFAPLGSSPHRRLSTPITQNQFVNNLSWVRGRHALKFGGEARRSHITDALRSSISGNFSFDTRPTGQPGVAASGNGLASLLLGFPSAFSVRDTPPLRRFSWYVAGFLQDDFTVTRNLTLNLGVRWETDTPITDADDRMNGFDMLAINPEISHAL